LKLRKQKGEVEKEENDDDEDQSTLDELGSRCTYKSEVDDLSSISSTKPLPLPPSIAPITSNTFQYPNTLVPVASSLQSLSSRFQSLLTNNKSGISSGLFISKVNGILEDIVTLEKDKRELILFEFIHYFFFTFFYLSDKLRNKKR
jgi:hypothetical protein